MPLNDIMAATADGSGGFGAADAANQTAAAIAGDVSTQPPIPTYSGDDLTHRMQIAKAVIPQLANDPVQLAAAARQNVPTEMLPQTLLAMNNVTKQADQVAVLGTMSKDQQKAIWSNLTEEQQQYLTNIGADLGGGGGGGGLGGFLSGAAHVVGQGIHYAGVGLTAPVRYPYRAATAIPVVGKAIEETTHYTVGEAAHYGVGLPVKAVMAAYKPVQAIPSHLYRMDQELTGGTMGSLLGLDFSNPLDRLSHAQQAIGDLAGSLAHPGKIADAWHVTADGDRYIRADHATQALTALGGDKGLYTDLLNLQAGDTLDQLVVRKGFTVGTPEYQQAVSALWQRTHLPDAVQAMQLIQRGKTSVGRDIARSAGIKEGSNTYTAVSGVGDAMWSWYSDPAIVGGHALSGLRVARYSLETDRALSAADQLAQRSNKMAELFGQALTPTTTADGRLVHITDEVGKPVAMAMGTMDPSVQRANQLILDAFKGGDTRAIKAALPQQADMIQDLAKWNAIHPFETVGDVATFFQAAQTQRAVAAGQVLDLAAKIETVPRITRVDEVTNALKRAGRGVIDFGSMNDWLRRGADLSSAIEHAGADHPLVLGLQERAAEYAARGNGTTQMARDFVGRWVAEPLSKGLESVVTHVMKGGEALSLEDASSIQSFDRVLRSGIYAHIPGPVQDVLFDAWTNGSVVQRRNIYQQFMSDLARGLNIDVDKVMEIPEQASKMEQRYSAWSNDVYNGLRVALDPVADVSGSIHVPKFRQLIAVSAGDNTIARFFSKTAEGLPGHYIDRIWAPSTLLRLAFIPRVVGDEALSFVLRQGPRAWMEGLATPLAYEPGRVWDPVNWMTRQVGRAIPASLHDAPMAQQMGAWWEATQKATADRLGQVLEHYVGQTKLEVYAGTRVDKVTGLPSPDPLRRFPRSALANNPTIATTMGRTLASHGHAFLAKDLDPELQRVLAFGTTGQNAATHWVTPISSGRFQEYERDLSWLKEGEQYAGNEVDSAITTAFAGRVNQLTSGSLYRPMVEELRRYVSDADLKRVTSLFEGGPGELPSFLGGIRNLPKPMQDQLYEVIADNRPGVMKALGESWQADGYGSQLTDWITSKMEGLDARQKSIIMAMADHPGPPLPPAEPYVRLYRGQRAAPVEGAPRNTMYSPEEFDRRRAAGEQLNLTQRGLPDEMSGRWFTADRKYATDYAQYDFPETRPEYQRGPKGTVHYVDLPASEAAKYQMGNLGPEAAVGGVHPRSVSLESDEYFLPSEHAAKAKEIKPRGRPKMPPPIQAEGPAHALISYSDPQFLRDRLEAKAREVLDHPELQRHLLKMNLYDDVGRQVPIGHVMMFGPNATPDAMDLVNEAHQLLGPNLFVAGPTVSDDARQVLAHIGEGFGTPDLQALQARYGRMGLGSIPLSNAADVRPEVIHEALGALRDNVAAVVSDPTALDEGLHVGYNHVDDQVLRHATAGPGTPDILGAHRPGFHTYALGNSSLAHSADYETWAGRPLETAKDEHAARVAAELQSTLTHSGTSREVETKAGETITRWEGGAVHHEIVAPALHGEVQNRHVNSMPNGYPTKTIGPEPQIVGPGGLWSKIVDQGYGKVISPAMDALIRQPMFLEHMSRAYEDASIHLRQWIYNQGLEDRAAAVVGGDVGALHDIGYELADRMPKLDPTAVAKMGTQEWEDFLDRSLNNRRIAAADANGRIGNVIDLNSYPGKAAEGLDATTKLGLPRYRDGILERLDSDERLHAALKTMSPDEASTVVEWARHRDAVESELANVAAERAVGSMIPFIHDHNERSQFQEFVRPFAPFQFAEEQFLKRWGRTFLYNPEAIGKAALTIGALRDTGLVQKDAQGNDVYVVPGSQQFMDLMFKTVPHIFGMPPVVPIASALTGSIQYSTPGFDLSGRPLQFSPLVGVPLKALDQIFPEFTPMSDQILGSRMASQGITDMVIPSHVRHLWSAVTALHEQLPEANNKNFANAMTQAMAQLQAGGHGLPENATADQVAQFQSRARNQARVIILAQALFGFVTPAAPQVAYDGELHPEYQALLSSGMSISDATSAFLQAHPDATPYTVFQTKVPGKATLPTTHEALNYLVDHRDFIDRYPKAGGWLLPQPTGNDPFVYAAYQQELAHGLRVQKTPDQWVHDVLYAEASPIYFQSRDAYDAAIKAAGTDTARKAAMTRAFQDWKTTYERMHPVFAREVSLRGEESKQARSEVRQELRGALGSKDLPTDTQSTALGAVLDSWDNYKAYLDSVAGDHRGIVTKQKAQVAATFLAWGETFTSQHPEATAFWQRIIQPDVSGG